MSMDNVFHPGVRKWISSPLHVETEVKKLQAFRDRLMKAVQDIPDLDDSEKRAQQDFVQNEEIEKERIKSKIFGPKKRGRTKKANESDEDENTDEFSDEEKGFFGDESEETSESDSEGLEDFSEGDDISGPIYNQMRKKKLIPNDELYMFDDSASSNSESDDEDVTQFNSIQVDAGLQSSFGLSNPENEFMAGPTNKLLETVMMVPPVDTSEKDMKEFKIFYDYALRRAKIVADRRIYEDKEEMLHILMTENDYSRHMAVNEFQRLSENTNPNIATTPSEVIEEDPLIKGSVMPILAGPIPNEALQAQGALALYAGLSDEPGNFQWRTGHVFDLLTAQSQGDMGFLRQEKLGKERLEAGKNVTMDDVIVSIKVYQPWEQTEDMLSELKTIPEPDFGYKIEMLGSQTLKDLCSMFRCQADLICTKPFRKPNLPASICEAFKQCEKDLTLHVTPFQAIFILDTIYVNFDEENTRNSQKLRGVTDWAERHRNDDGIREIKVSTEMNKKIKDLIIQLGYPYLYAHQTTNCEHIFVFESVRLTATVEPTVYPRFTSVGKFPTKYCVVDNELLARWAVVDCDRLPQNPMFLCTDCVKAYCFSRTTPYYRIGTFKLYPYFQLIHHIH